MFFERESRQQELALFVIPKSLEIVGNFLHAKNFFIPFKHGEVILVYFKNLFICKFRIFCLLLD